jgi:hypothetical protein
MFALNLTDIAAFGLILLILLGCLQIGQEQMA